MAAPVRHLGRARSGLRLRARIASSSAASSPSRAGRSRPPAPSPCTVRGFEMRSRHDAHRGHRPAAGRSGRPRDAAAHRAGPGPGRCRRGCRRRPRAGRAPAPGCRAPRRRSCSTATASGRAVACARSSIRPRVVLYSAGGDPSLQVTARVAGADGLVDKAAPRRGAVRGASASSARGGSALPPLDREQLDAAAHRVDAGGPRAAGDARGPHRARRRRGDAAAGPAQAGAAHRAAARPAALAAAHARIPA